PAPASARSLTKRRERALLDSVSNTRSTNPDSAAAETMHPAGGAVLDPRCPSEGARRSEVGRPGQRGRVSPPARHQSRSRACPTSWPVPDPKDPARATSQQPTQLNRARAGLAGPNEPDREVIAMTIRT